MKSNCPHGVATWPWPAATSWAELMEAEVLPSDGYGAFSALRGVRQKSAVCRSYEVRLEVDRELFPKDVNVSTWEGGEESCSNPKGLVSSEMLCGRFVVVV